MLFIQWKLCKHKRKNQFVQITDTVIGKILKTGRVS